MKLPTFLKKELAWSRHRLLTVVVLFVLVPAIFVTGTLFFEHTLPEDSPVAVVPEGGDVSGDDLDAVRAGLAFISDPRIVASPSEAFAQLHREEVYAVVEVPTGVTSPGANVTIDVYIDGNVTIFRLPSRAMVALLSDSLDGILPANVDAERHVLGAKKRLAEYLLPTFLMIVVMLVAFVYLPASLSREANVLDRLRIKSRLEWIVAAKLLFVAVLSLASVLTVYLVGLGLGYSLQPLSIPAVATYLLSFLFLASIAGAVSFATGFSTAGRVLNVAVFFALVPLSNLAYPAGFFSPLSRTIARLNPLHYAMIVARSHLLKEARPGAFAGWMVGLLAFAAACLLVLELSIRYYEHSDPIQ